MTNDTVCDTCMEDDHEVCWTANNPDPNCPCCRSTIIAMEEEE